MMYYGQYQNTILYIESLAKLFCPTSKLLFWFSILSDNMTYCYYCYLKWKQQYKYSKTSKVKFTFQYLHKQHREFKILLIFKFKFLNITKCLVKHSVKVAVEMERWTLPLKPAIRFFRSLPSYFVPKTWANMYSKACCTYLYFLCQQI